MTTRVLGIETSCDETAAAVVVDGHHVASNVVHSQIALHERFGGIVPEIASRSHTTRILPIVDAALHEAGIAAQELDAVAVTHRPGMVGSLIVGLTAAKTLSLLIDRPLIGVDHVQAHVHTARMTAPDLDDACLVLVASGGHTALYELGAPGAAVRIGRTRDDAAGEAFDKGAALLGLPYPGGPSIEKAAAGGDPTAVRLPRTLLDRDSLDFSFSGLKTALLYHLRGPGAVRPMPELSPSRVADVAASFQAAIVDTLVTKLRRAFRQRPHVTALAIGGGVARNTLLRERLANDRELGGLRLVLPPLDLCSDNGAMVAGLGTALWLARGRTSDGFDLDARAVPRPER